VSVLQTSDYSELKVFAERQEPTAEDDGDLDEAGLMVLKTLCKICRTYESLATIGCSRTIFIEARMGRASFQKDKAELLWICQDHPILFEQAYDESEYSDPVLRIPAWYSCCVALACLCMRRCRDH